MSFPSKGGPFGILLVFPEPCTVVPQKQVPTLT